METSLQPNIVATTNPKEEILESLLSLISITQLVGQNQLNTLNRLNLLLLSKILMNI